MQKEARTCAKCGAQNNASNKTCVGCGTAL